MKTIANVFLALGILANLIVCVSYSLSYAQVAQYFAQNGMDFASFMNPAVWVAALVISFLISVVIAVLSFIALNKQPLNKTFLLVMGILCVLMNSRVAGILMLVYVSTLDGAKGTQSAKATPTPSTPKDEYSIDPHDYDAPESHKEEEKGPESGPSARSYFSVGDKVITPGGKRGTITAISYNQANVSFQDGSGDRIMPTDSLRRDV